jgi:hypothetical protein
MGVTLKYGSSSKDFEEIALKGFDDPDEIKFLLFRNKIMPDGSVYQSIPAFKRVMTLDLGVIQSKPDRVWIHNFLMSDTKVISYLGIELPVDLEDPETFANEFWDGCETLRYYVIRLCQKLPSVSIPVEFGTQAQLYTNDDPPQPVYDSDGRPVYVWT